MSRTITACCVINLILSISIIYYLYMQSRREGLEVGTVMPVNEVGTVSTTERPTQMEISSTTARKNKDYIDLRCRCRGKR